MTTEDRTKKVSVQMGISIFKIPPCEDILVIGKKAPIGKNAAMKMLECCAPDQFELIEVENSLIDALVIKKGFTKLIGKNQLTKTIIEEVSSLMEEKSILHIGLEARLISTKTIKVTNDSSE